MSLLWQIAGVEDLPPEGAPVPVEARALLVEHARLFLVAGGSFGLAEWDGLDQAERAALVAAGRAVAVEQAVRIGRAAQGEIAALRVQAEIDGGDEHDDAVIAAGVRAVSRAAGGSHAS